MNNNKTVSEILDLIRSSRSEAELREALENYHDNDIADALEELTKEERIRLYDVLGEERTADVFSYVDDVEDYLRELNLDEAADIIEEMDVDDAVDLLEQIDDDVEEDIMSLVDEEFKAEVDRIQSYSDDEIGSLMTTNCIVLYDDFSIKEAMKELIHQSEDNDNIDTLLVLNAETDMYCGVIDLRDLIKARDGDPLKQLIITSYPTVRDHEKIVDVLNTIRDYSEDSIPVLSEEGLLMGVITSQDITEAVGVELSEDYARLGGLSSSEELDEGVFQSVRKRLPWLAALLGLGIAVSAVVGIFENVVKEVAIIVSFQSLVLDMAGNVGTQSLAVTIRVLMDKEVTFKDKMKLVFKELRVGLTNGALLGIASFIFIGLYIHIVKHYPTAFSFKVSLCVGVALITAMLISSIVGTVVPIIFDAIHVDPAVASGPFITTINDLIAVISYYGLAWLLLINAV